MSTPYDKITNGRDYNFFKKITVTSASFQTECDALITFPITSFSLLIDDGAGVIEYSFNGNTTHGDMDSTKSSRGLMFDNRNIRKIWFKLISGGPITVRVEAW